MTTYLRLKCSDIYLFNILSFQDNWYTILKNGYGFFAKRTKILFLFRGMSRAFDQGKIPFFGEGGGVKYLILTKDILVLASAPHVIFFIRGTNILYQTLSGACLKGAYAPPPDLIHQGHMLHLCYTARHASDPVCLWELGYSNVVKP